MNSRPLAFLATELAKSREHLQPVDSCRAGWPWAGTPQGSQKQTLTSPAGLGCAPPCTWQGAVICVGEIDLIQLPGPAYIDAVVNPAARYHVAVGMRRYEIRSTMMTSNRPLEKRQSQYVLSYRLPAGLGG